MGESQNLVLVLLQCFGNLLLAGDGLRINASSQDSRKRGAYVGLPPIGAVNWVTSAP